MKLTRYQTSEVKRFFRNLNDPTSFWLMTGGFVMAWTLSSASQFVTIFPSLFFGLTPLLYWLGRAYVQTKKNPFESAQILYVWNEAKDRISRLEAAIREQKKVLGVDMSDLLVTVRRVHQSLFNALRNADDLADELTKSERSIGPIANAPPAAPIAGSGPETNRLLQIAEKQRAEYLKTHNSLHDSVSRTIAEARVFVTTLDNVRIRLLGYRMINMSDDFGREEFLHSLTEVKTSLDSMDKSLGEINLDPYGLYSNKNSQQLDSNPVEVNDVEPPQEQRS